MVGYGISEENKKFVDNETISAISHIRIINLVEGYERAFKCKSPKLPFVNLFLMMKFGTNKAWVKEYSGLRKTNWK